MTGPARGRHDELDRYLLEGERLVTAVHRHWAQVAEPVGSALAACVLAFWVDARVSAEVGWLSTATWWLFFAVAARAAYRVAEWRHDWFVATDKRLLLFYGFITRKVSMMPLIKVTDMSYERSVPGRVLGYGRFVMESAGQDQALREVNWVPQPDEHYRAICAEIFGVAEPLLDADGHDDRWDDGPWDGPPRDGAPWDGGPWDGPVGGELPDPYAGWDSPRHSPPHPGHRRGGGDDTLYRSPDLRARDRSADTGPIPIRQRPVPRPGSRRDWGDD